MRLTVIVAALLALGTLMACGSQDGGGAATKSETATPEVRGGYASLDGLRMYYEIQGSGRPLVLLHGGLCTIEACPGKVRPPLAKTWKTIAVEQQAHGHTADVDRPLTFEQMRKTPPRSSGSSRSKMPTFSATATEAM